MIRLAEHRPELLETCHRIGTEAAAPAAASVDRDARFPAETIDALRAARLLGALVPTELGGLGCGIREVAMLCRILGQYCASSAMVYAMHQIQVACLVRHGLSTPFFRDYLAELARDQGLIASATSEVGVGGDIRTSICAVTRDGERFAISKQAPVISYGEYARDILVTARRAPDAAANDQVLVLVLGPDTTLEATNPWDALGFRGTCSLGFRLSAVGRAAQILPAPYADISSRTMLPVSHILWSSLWLGIATDAVSRARAFVRGEARKTRGTVPQGAPRAADASRALQTMRATVDDALRSYERLMDDADALASLSFSLEMNNLKIATSQAVVEIVGQALLVCGMAAYTLDSPFSLGRQLRDAYGAMVMISNDRISATNASMLLVLKGD